MTAVLLATRRQSSALTQREEPHREHVNSRGRVAAAVMPTWPHDVHSILTIICAPPRFRGDEKAPGITPPGAEVYDDGAGKPKPLPRSDVSTLAPPV